MYLQHTVHCNVPTVDHGFVVELDEADFLEIHSASMIHGNRQRYGFLVAF